MKPKNKREWEAAAVAVAAEKQKKKEIARKYRLGIGKRVDEFWKEG